MGSHMEDPSASFCSAQRRDTGCHRGQLGRAKRARSCALPSAQKTLYHLARLDRGVLLSLISQGTIRPALTVWQAQDLMALHKPLSNRRSPRSQVKQRLSKFKNFVKST